MAKGVPSAHIATFEDHLVLFVDARTASHYSFLEGKSCQLGFAVGPNNFAGASLGLWHQNTESRPV